MRLLVVGRLSGLITQAVKMAMNAGAKVAHVETCGRATEALRAGQGADLLMVDYELDIGALIAANEADAHRFGCNAVVVGKTVVINAGCERLAADLAGRGYTPVAVELDEFIKSGGSAKCLTLRLDGEEAAVCN